MHEVSGMASAVKEQIVMRGVSAANETRAVRGGHEDSEIYEILTSGQHLTAS